MANDKNKNNELVSEDEPTAEIELLVPAQVSVLVEEQRPTRHEFDPRVFGRFDQRSTGERVRAVQVLIGTVAGRELRYPLFKDCLTIGRTRQNDIQLNAANVSRRHAVVVTDGDATRLIDWGSKNGVFVNAQRITEHFLKTGDVITIGIVKLRYECRLKRKP